MTSTPATIDGTREAIGYIRIKEHLCVLGAPVCVLACVPLCAYFCLRAVCVCELVDDRGFRDHHLIIQACIYTQAFAFERAFECAFEFERVLRCCIPFKTPSSKGCFVVVIVGSFDQASNMSSCLKYRARSGLIFYVFQRQRLE